MTHLILGFVFICAIGIIFNFTMKYKTLYKIQKERNKDDRNN